MRGKEGEKKREKGEATSPCSGYIRGDIARKNVHAPFSYSSCIASSFFSSSISSFFYLLLPSPTPSLPPPTSTPSRLRRPFFFAPRTTDVQEKKGEKKGSTPDCDHGQREETDNDGGRLHARGTTGGERRERGRKGRRETDARRPVREEGTREREKRKRSERGWCADGVSRHSRETERATRQKRFGALLAASRRVEKPEAPGKTRFPN